MSSPTTPDERNSGRNAVLVLDGNGQSALSVVRSLGRRSVPVTVGSHTRRSLGALSKHSDGQWLAPDLADGAAYLDALVEHLDGTDYFAVFPIRDETTALLSKHADEIEATDTVVAAEDWETFRRAYDKADLFELVADCSVPTPATHAPESLAGCGTLADRLDYPVVVKPRSKTAWGDDGSLHHYRVSGGNYADSPEELVDTFASLLGSDPLLEDRPPVVQEYVEGTTVTVVGLAESGEFRAVFQEERVRTTPPEGGNSTLLRALADPELTDYAAEVVEALDWTGPVMVEFMRTPDGTAYLIEVNGRYWGSLPFAIESGVDVPWLHYTQLRGNRVERPESYRTDVRQQRLLYEDVEWLRAKLDAGEWTAMGEFLRTCATARQTFVSCDDPMPTLGALGQAAVTGAKTVGRTLGRSGTGSK